MIKPNKNANLLFTWYSDLEQSLRSSEIMRFFSWFLTRFSFFRKKGKEIASFETPVESTLQSLYIISSPVYDILNGQPSKKKNKLEQNTCSIKVDII